tara:strand:- start:493 stop:825 length:333 start_codon:yes stop_codon:yes gene_type:complete
MTRALTFVTYAIHHYGFLGLTAFALFFMSGCSGFSLNTGGSKNIWGERSLGTLSVMDTTDSPTRLSAHKIKKGYAVRSNLDRKGNYEHNAVFQRDKEYDWFAGMQWRWAL